MREIIAYVTSWYTNEEINMQIFRLLLAVESLCFVSHGIVLTVSHAIETLVGCSHKQILWLLVFRRRVRTGSSTLLLVCFGFALRWRFRERIYRTIGSGGNLKDFLSSSFEFSRLLSNDNNCSVFLAEPTILKRWFLTVYCFFVKLCEFRGGLVWNKYLQYNS